MTGTVLDSVQLLFVIQKLMYLWVRSRAFPDGGKPELGINPNLPVCYVFRSKSMSDLIVLDHHCRQKNLPRPRASAENHPEPAKAGQYIYLVKPGLVQIRTSKEVPSKLSTLMAHVEATSSDVQIVPVTVIWGRNPGSEDKSVLKLLSFDYENGGILHRIFTVLFHGRNVICNYGKPISALEMIREGAGLEQTVKKLRRVLRVHFRSQRVAALGPQIYDRNQMIISLLKSKAVEEAIQDEARKKRIPEDRVREKAKHYLDEISASMTSQAISALAICLNWFFHRIYNGVSVRHGDRVLRIASSSEVVYVPCHRSHIDYLLISYCIYNLGIMTPHIAAGINLNFWPAGGLLRRAGAFFIRRSFKGNRLYSVVFNEYVLYLLHKGYSLKFFPEGGRSRTGRLLQPKTGMLSMIVEGYARQPNRPVYLVPVYVGYDKVLEEGSYLSELRGKKKRAESFGQLLKAGKFLSNKYGKAYVNFGEPINLADRLPHLKSDHLQIDPNSDAPAGYLGTATQAIAKDLMVRINNTAIVSSTSLFAIGLLSSSKRALPESDLVGFVELLIKVLQTVPYHKDVAIPQEPVSSQLISFEQFSGVTRFSHPDGDVVYADETEATRLTYYRNNALHLIAVPSLICAFFQHNDTITVSALRDSCAYIYQFLKDELFIHFSAAEFPKYFDESLQTLEGLGLITRENAGSTARRPDFVTREFQLLNMFGRCLGSTIERFAVSSAFLAKFESRESFPREEFEKACQLMSQRIAILNGTSEPEHHDQHIFRSQFDMLKQFSYIERTTEEGRYRVRHGAGAAAAQSIGLLSHDLRQTITRSSPAGDTGVG